MSKDFWNEERAYTREDNESDALSMDERSKAPTSEPWRMKKGARLFAEFPSKEIAPDKVYGHLVDDKGEIYYWEYMLPPDQKTMCPLQFPDFEGATGHVAFKLAWLSDPGKEDSAVTGMETIRLTVERK